MTAVAWPINKASGSTAAAATVYIPTACGHAGPSTTESAMQVPNRVAGVYSNLWIRVTTNNRGASTLKFRSGGVNGNQSVSIGASSTGDFEDTSNTDTVAGTGELLSLQLITGSGGTAFTWANISIKFAATTNTAIIYQSLGSGTTRGPNTDCWQSICGLGGNGSTESVEQYKIKHAGTFQYLFANITTNSLTTATATVKFRKNTADGNMSVSISAGATGIFEDTTHSDSVVSGDLVNYTLHVASGGSGSITLGDWGCAFITTDATFDLITGTSGGLSINTATTLYFAPGGAISANNATEDLVKVRCGIVGRLINLQINVSANSLSGGTSTSTLTSRKNAGAGNQSVSIANGSTGYFEDTTNTDSYVAADYINYAITTGGSGGGSIKINDLGAKMAVLQTVVPTAIDSGATLGSNKVNGKIAPSAIASTVSYGTLTIRAAGANILPSSIGSTLGIGSPSLKEIIRMAGIASTLGLGTPALAARIRMAGLVSGYTIGNPTVTNVNKVLPTGIASTLSIGTPSLRAILGMSGIAATTTLGTPLLRALIAMSGIASGSVLGAPVVGNVNTLAVSGIDSTLTLGTPKEILILTPSGRASTLTIGTPSLRELIGMSGIASTLSFGMLSLNEQGKIGPIGIASTATLGTLRTKQSIQPSGRASTLNVGTPRLRDIIHMNGLPSGATLGGPTVVYIHVLRPSGIVSTVSLGVIRLMLAIRMNGIQSTVTLGTSSIGSFEGIRPNGIDSTLIMGVPYLILYPGFWTDDTIDNLPILHSDKNAVPPDQMPRRNLIRS